MKVVKYNENKHINYLIPLSEKRFPNNVYMDITVAVRNAMARDKRMLGRDYEQGPNYAQEIHRAVEYAKYVDEYATEENVSKFNVPSLDYYFHVNTSNEDITENV